VKNNDGKNVNSVSNNDSIVVAAMVPIVVTINVLKRQMFERKLKDDTYGIIRFSLSQSYPVRDKPAVLYKFTFFGKDHALQEYAQFFIKKIAILYTSAT